MEYFVISAKFVPLKYYTLSSQLQRLTSFSVGCSGRRILSHGQIAVIRKWSIAGFFIPVRSLKVFDHSIHSERRRIYLGKLIQALQMSPLSYHDYSVSRSSSQQCSGMPLKLLCLFSSILVHKKLFELKVIKVPNQYSTHMTFSNKIQGKTFTWPDMSFCAR